MTTVTATEPEVSSVIDLERDYLLQNYARYPIVLSRGKGPYVWDTNGKKYLDFISGIGVNALGHAPSSDHKSNPRSGRKADSQLESLLPRVSGAAREETCGSKRSAASFLQQLRYGVDGRRAEDGPLARESHFA